MNPSQGNLLDIHQVLGPLLMKYWIDRLESEATDFESIGNTHNSSHYRAIATRLRNYSGTPLVNGAEVQAHITGVGAAMAQKFDQWTAELQSVADLGSTLGNQNTTTNNNANTANTNNNNNFTTPTAPSRKRSLSDSQNNLSPINNNNGSLPANVADWLRDLGLSEYLATFVSNGITSINQVLELTQNHLRQSLLVINPDHIRTLLNGINSLKLIKLSAFPELSKLNEISIRQWGLNNDKIFPRAVEYVQHGKVLQIVKDGTRYQCRVSGNDSDALRPEYNVVVRFGIGRGDPILSIEHCLCSCKFFQRQKLKPPCKHLIAVLLQMYHRSETIKIKVSQPSPVRANSQTISPRLTSSNDDNNNNNNTSPPKRSRKSPSSGTSKKKSKKASDTPLSPEAIWFEAVERYAASLDPDSQPSQQTSSQSSQTASTPKRPKEYLPKPRSGPWALLLALHRAEQIPGYLGYLSSADLKTRAQPLCDSSFDLVAPSPDYRQNFTAWNSMKTLEDKGFVKTITTPDFYTLTESGRELAVKLETIAEESQSVGNFSPGAKPLGNSGSSPNTNLLSSSNNNHSNRSPTPSLSRSMSAPVTPSVPRNPLPVQPLVSPSQPPVTVSASQPQLQATSLHTSPVKPLSASQNLARSQNLSQSQDILSQSQNLGEDELEIALRVSREARQRAYFFVDASGVKVESKENAEVEVDEKNGVLKYRIKYKDTGQYSWITEASAQDFDVDDDEDMDAVEESVMSEPIGTQNSIAAHPELLVMARLMGELTSQQMSQPAQPLITTTPPPSVPPKEILLSSGTAPTKTPTASPVHAKTSPVSRVLFPASAIDLTESDDEAQEQPLNFRLPNTPNPSSPSLSKPASTPQRTNQISSASPVVAPLIPSVTITPPANRSPGPVMTSPPLSKSPNLPSSPVIISTPPPLVPATPAAPIVQPHHNTHASPSLNNHNNIHDEHASLLPGLTNQVEGYHLPTELLKKSLHETEIVLVLDHREQWPDIDMDRELKAKGIRVERRELKLSDLVFVIRGVNHDTPEYMMNLVIERKQASDFFASIRDKRLEEQKHRLRTLKSYGINAMVLLEGRLGVEANKENVCILLPQEHLDNMIFMEGFPVKKTKSPSQTFEFLTQAYVYLQEALKGARIRISGLTFEEYNRLNAKSVGLTRQALFERQLMQFHTMTPLTAKTITQTFPTVKHLVEAFTKRGQPEMLCELEVSAANPFHPVSKELSTRLFHYYCQ